MTLGRIVGFNLRHRWIRIGSWHASLSVYEWLYGPVAQLNTRTRARIWPRWVAAALLWWCRRYHPADNHAWHGLPVCGQEVGWEHECRACGCKHLTWMPHGWRPAKVVYP